MRGSLVSLALGPPPQIPRGLAPARLKSLLDKKVFPSLGRLSPPRTGRLTCAFLFQLQRELLHLLFQTLTFRSLSLAIPLVASLTSSKLFVKCTPVLAAFVRTCRSSFISGIADGMR
ncbi:hypothetical protein PC116_g22319 [Phytophthora cactorum]|uniref:Uncharacterized protein n=1 Tax=Phytophthora cactorum TaxID=29920 RepID=A0A8T1K160_9STRA|nr:hypothetical protein PC117_g19958 [Phytophthora cactorum]KAG4229342.1 hypothetical protein PC116_g22319 [Phytophthora cactorum]